MTTPKSLRWLAVANRAAQFRTLIQGAEVHQLAHVAGSSAAAHAAGRSASREAESRWRLHMLHAQFHGGDIAQHQRHQQQLAHRETELAEAAERTQGQLEQSQSLLRHALAQRDGLFSALQRGRNRLRQDIERQAHKEADETWNVMNQGDRHEDQ